MAIAFRVATTARGTAGTANLTIPAGVQVGDVMVMVVSWKLGTSSAFNVPTGWTVVGGPVNGQGATFQGVTLRRTAIGGDAGTVVAVNSPAATQQIEVELAAYSGAQDAPRDSGLAAEGTTASTTASADAETVGAGDVILLVAAARGSTNGPTQTPTFTAPTGYTIRQQSAATSGSAQNVAAVIMDGTASGAQTLTASHASWWITGQIVLQEAVTVQAVEPAGIAPASAVGSPTLAPGTVTISPDGLTSTATPGSPTVTPGPVTVTAAGIATTANVGAPTTTAGSVTVAPDGVAATSTSGAPTLTPGPVTVSPPSATQANAVGVPVVNPAGLLTVTLAGLAETTAAGTPTVSPGPVTVTITSVVSTVAFGTPALTPGQVAVAPAGIAPASAVGAPTLVAGPVAVTPTGLASTITYGTPTLVLAGTVVARPDDGTTTRPTGGTTARPTTGTTYRPGSDTTTRPYTGITSRQ